MRIIDARSGLTAYPGGRIDHGGGESIELHEVEPGLLHARARITSKSRNPMTGQLSTWSGWVPLRVRWMHPSFRFQHVAFLPT